MSIPPYLLGPNPWATMMAQQQAHAQLAAAQAHAQAAAQAAHHAHMQAVAGPPLPQMPKQPEVLSEDKLQEKGNVFFQKNNYNIVFYTTVTFLYFSAKMATATVKAICGEKKVWFCGCPKRRYASRAYKKDYQRSW